MTSGGARPAAAGGGAAPCRACRGEWPQAEDRIADLGLSVVYLHEDQFFPGWTVVVLKRHATELFDLSRGERGQLVEEVAAVARAVATAFEAAKVNYGLLGNQLPHIHWHVIPRLASDPAPRDAVWGVRHEPLRLAVAERDARRQKIRALLA